mgnify:FL=1
MWEEYGFVGLFAVSFGAATILPVSSELVFASMTGPVLIPSSAFGPLLPATGWAV